jgi:Na+/proline symporter
MSDMTDALVLAPLPTTLAESVGWFTVLGFGFVFTVLTMGITNLESSMLGKGGGTSEEFATAGRNLGMGLVAADIVSQWTWAATLLMSSNMCWKVGVSGSYWYAAGASVQIMLFAILATQVKRRAPNMRTFMEMVRVRWGTFAHKTFICFALTTNVIVSAMLILGGAATLNALTGMPTNAAAFLVPIVACLPYTLMGGLRATFLAHYFNTFFIFVALFVFMFSGYISGDGAFYGSPDLVLESMEETTKHAVFTHVDWDPASASPETNATYFGFQGFGGFIQNAGICYKETEDGVEALDKSCTYTAQGINEYCHEACKTNSLAVQACGNMEAGCITFSETDHWVQSGCDSAASEVCGPSLATMASHSGLSFGIVNIGGNFGTVFVDQSYWQSAIAVKPESAASGYILGGVVWFAVPMMMGTTHGLVGRALTTNFDLFNGASHITADDSGSGLTPARVAVEMQGQAGAWILLIMLFMAIVSTGCAEIIAVATIMTYDVYCEYLNPELKAERMRGRQIFYATMMGMKANFDPEGKDLVTVEEISNGSIERVSLSQVDQKLTELEMNLILPGGKKFTAGAANAIEKLLQPYKEADDTVTFELFYYAIQSKALCKCSHESDVLMRVMKFFCCCFAVFMGFLAVFLQTLGLGLGFVYMSMGIFVGPAVFPAAMAILMETANKTWCTIGAIAGLFGGLTTWVLVAYSMYGKLTVATLSDDYSFLWSNVVSICFSGLVAIAGSLANPDETFKWKHLAAQLPLVDDMPPPIEKGKTAADLEELLKKSYNRSVFMANFLFIFLCLIFPVGLYFSGMVFGSTMFTIWIAVFAGWCYIGGLVVMILPIVDFKKDLQAATAAKANGTEYKETGPIIESKANA